MLYYADGDRGMIRIDAHPDATGQAILRSKSQSYAPNKGFIDVPGRNMAAEAMYSGDYEPVAEAKVSELLAAIDAYWGPRKQLS